MGLGYEVPVVFDQALAIGVLYDGAKDVGSELKRMEVPDDDADSLRYGTRMYHRLGRGEHMLIHKQGIGSLLHLRAGACTMEHGSGLGCSGGLVQQRAVGQG